LQQLPPDLETQLLREFEATLGEAWRRCRYNPHYFAAMLREHGAVETAETPVKADRGSAVWAFRLADCGRLDLSVEAIVLKPIYAPLFTQVERGVARERLDRLGYTQCPSPGKSQESDRS
jgi:hypothetical protein